MAHIFNTKKFLEERVIKKHRRMFKDDINYTYLVLCGSSMGAKSYDSAMLNLYRLLRYDNYNVIFFAKTVENVRAVGYNQYLQCIKNTPEFAGLFNYSESLGGRGSMRISSKTTGSSIEFKTFINIDTSLKSNANICCYIFEEADRFTENEVTTAIRYARGTAEFQGKEIKPHLMIMLNPNECWIKNFFFDNKRDDSLVIKTNWRDNNFLTKEQIASVELTKEQYDKSPTNPLYKHNYTIYYLGEWSTSIGLSIFNVDRVNNMIESHNIIFNKKFDIFYSESERRYIAEPDDNGFLEIYKHPINGTCYVMGLDTRDDTSNNQKDYCVGMVLDAATREIVACYRQNILSSIENEEMIYKILKFYNYAWFVPEINKYSDYILTQMVQKGKYLNYVEHKGKFGIYMEKKSKPECINLIQQYVDDENNNIKCLKLLEELRTYTNNGKSLGAEYGKNDDTVMAFGVALYSLQNELFDITRPRLYENQNNNIIRVGKENTFGLSNINLGSNFF